MVMTTVSTAVLADAVVSTTIYDQTANNTKQLLGKSVNEITYSQNGSSAYAYANLNTGILRGFASASPNLDSSHYAEFVTSIRDTITFSPGATGIGYLNWHWDGFSNSEVPTNAGIDYTAILNIYLITSSYRINEEYVLTPGACVPGRHAGCTSGVVVNQYGQIPFLITSGGLFIQEGIAGFATMGRLTDFSHTGTLSLSLPKGVTFTSASGSFLSEVSPNAPSTVPEPSSFALLGLGFLGLVFSGARSKNLLGLK